MSVSTATSRRWPVQEATLFHLLNANEDLIAQREVHVRQTDNLRRLAHRLVRVLVRAALAPQREERTAFLPRDVAVLSSTQRTDLVALTESSRSPPHHVRAERLALPLARALRERQSLPPPNIATCSSFWECATLQTQEREYMSFTRTLI